MPYPTLQILNEQGDLSSPSYKDLISNEDLLKGYRVMCLTRQIDERMITLQRQGIISFAMSSLGEEACAVASAAALNMGDWIYPQYRESGVMFWRGCTALQYIHQMFGNEQDLTFGRQMPNHFGARVLNVVTVSSPIGTKIPHAAGCAYAMKIQKEKQVAICFFGEGATSEGDFHAGVNFAAVRKVPTIFFCRNNGYAISTPWYRQFATEGIVERGPAYGILAERIDGNDFFAVYDSVLRARNNCLEGKGPTLIEAMTYRMSAHSTSDDPSLYRQEQEVVPWQTKCPISRLRKYLEKNGLWDAQKEEKMTKEIADEITAAIAKAKQTPRPPLKYIIEHVYFEVPPKLKDEYEQLRQLFPNEG